MLGFANSMEDSVRQHLSMGMGLQLCNAHHPADAMRQLGSQRTWDSAYYLQSQKIFS